LPDRTAEWTLPDGRARHNKLTMVEKSVIAVDFDQAILA
jgi:hypothetical protein